MEKKKGTAHHIRFGAASDSKPQKQAAAITSPLRFRFVTDNTPTHQDEHALFSLHLKKDWTRKIHHRDKPRTDGATRISIAIPAHLALLRSVPSWPAVTLTSLPPRFGTDERANSDPRGGQQPQAGENKKEMMYSQPSGSESTNACRSINAWGKKCEETTGGGAGV